MENIKKKKSAAVALGKLGGLKGGKARAAKLSRNALGNCPKSNFSEMEKSSKQ